MEKLKMKNKEYILGLLAGAIIASAVFGFDYLRTEVIKVESVSLTLKADEKSDPRQVVNLSETGILCLDVPAFAKQAELNKKAAKKPQ